MELLRIFQERRSIRSYTGEPVPEEALKQILQAGLLAASGRAKRPWTFLVVRERETLQKMARCRPAGAGMLAQADCAVVVLGDEEQTDVWVEDCSIAMANMHLMADALGVGSCWVQGRLREAPGGGTAEEFLRDLLGFPEHLRLEAVLSLGMPAERPEPRALDTLDWSKVHRERY